MHRPSRTLVHPVVRRIAGLAVACLLLAACSTQDVEVAGVTITSTTTTTIPVPVAIDDFVGLEWQPGGVYTADRFIVPVEFTTDRAGWLSRGADRRWASLWFDEDLDGETDATLTLMAHRPTTEADVLLTEILRIEGVRQLDQAFERTIGANKMIVVDVEGEPEPQGGGLSDCSLPPSGQFTTIAGYEFFEDGSSLGIPACYRSRLWLAEIDGSVITMVGVASDDDEFEDMMSVLEMFLESGVSFSS